MAYLAITRKEMQQVEIFEKLLSEQITQMVAARMLKLSDRQVRNKLARYKEGGAESLIHRNRGKPSKRKWDSKQETFALELLRSTWRGFGPTFAAEKLLEEHGIKVSAETLRKAMIKKHLWVPKQRKVTKRRRRERRAIFGIMIQLDGSPHDWFEGRGPKCTLLVFIDDATSEIVWLEFVKSESVDAVMTATKHYFLKHGIPVSFYVDFGSVFSVNTNNKDRLKLSQFERAMKECGTEVIHAHSPQAKGRVERANSTLQDRLVKEMRLANISTIEEANQFVQSGYLEKHNQQFAVAPQQTGDAHRSIDGYDLDRILCIKDTRKVQNDMVISYKKQLFQLHKQQRAVVRPKEEVTVYEQFDGNFIFNLRGYDLSFDKIEQKPVKPPVEKVYNQKPRPVHPNSRRWAGGKAPMTEGIRHATV